ncbi:MAG: hypothetical protein ACQERI_10515 [Candidatus Krumholzibacteriota bacterium]
MNYISNGKYRKGLERLRELNGRLEELEGRAGKIPADERIEIDTSSEELAEKKKLILLLMSRFENAAPEKRGDLKSRIDRDLEEFGRGIEILAEMIGKKENGQLGEGE